MPHIRDQRQPGGALGRRSAQTGARECVVDDGAELVLRNARRKMTERGFNLGWSVHDRSWRTQWRIQPTCSNVSGSRPSLLVLGDSRVQGPELLHSQVGEGGGPGDE